MAPKCSALGNDDEGETVTSRYSRLSLIPNIIVPALRLNHLFLVPSIIVSLPSTALFQQGILIILVLVGAGLGGMLTRNSAGASLVSVALLGLILWGRVSSDLWGLGGLDSALLLLEFFLVILFMEASNATILFDSTYRLLRGKDDETSAEARVRLIEWAKNQFLNLGKLMATAFMLSLGLLVVGDLVSISVNQLAFEGVLVLAAVVALLVLVTYSREPEDRVRPRG